MDGRGIKMERAIKIIAGVGAVLLIIFLLILTMGFTGNPISKVLATRTADKYIEENYSDLDLKREETVYEFKRGYYIVKYYNKNSKDIHFGIETDYLGRITYDGYEGVVLSKWNTIVRLNDEFGVYVEQIVRDNLDYDFNMIIADTFGDEENEEKISQLEIDMNIDMENIPLDKYLTIYIYEENRTWTRVAEVMLELDELMEEYNLNIRSYSVVLEEPREEEAPAGDGLGIYEFPKELLDSEDLPKALEEFYNGWNE